MMEQKHVGEGRAHVRPHRQSLGWATVLLVLALVLSGCGPLTFSPATADYEADVAQAWFDLSLQLVQETPGFTPPVASRAFGYLGVTLYESVRPGMFRYRSLAGQLNELWDMPTVQWFTRYHWPTAANSAMASLLRRLFPTATPENLAAIDALEEQFAEAYMATVDTVTFRRSVAWGEAVADAVYAWSLTDGGHEGYARNFPTDFVPPVGEGLWVPTPPNYQSALQPYWGDNRPFMLRDPYECPIAPPTPYSEDPTSAFYAEAREVYDTVLNGNVEQATIAGFWADDPGRTSTPPGHWVSILNQVLAKEEASLAVASESYAKVGIALADAFITCWHTKYVYNLVRPLTYIQAVIDPTWNTPAVTDPVLTPPFPEYPSGHSVQSGAAAAVLSNLFGIDYAFTDHTHDALGMTPRSFASFDEAADEAAISRLYGGIHYRPAIENGVAQGRCVGERVLELRFGPR
jgi:hypothetical protein